MHVSQNRVPLNFSLESHSYFASRRRHTHVMSPFQSHPPQNGHDASEVEHVLVKDCRVYIGIGGFV